MDLLKLQLIGGNETTYGYVFPNAAAVGDIVTLEDEDYAYIVLSASSISSASIQILQEDLEITAVDKVYKKTFDKNEKEE